MNEIDLYARAGGKGLESFFFFFCFSFFFSLSVTFSRKKEREEEKRKKACAPVSLSPELRVSLCVPPQSDGLFNFDALVGGEGQGLQQQQCSQLDDDECSLSSLGSGIEIAVGTANGIVSSVSG
jgi:hypothetical protein